MGSYCQLVADLLPLVKGIPALAVTLAVLGAVLYAAERVFALSGPVSKLVAWWNDRELARLRREAIIRAERRRLQQEEESAVMSDLRIQLRDLTTEVARLRSAVRTSEAHNRVMRDWADGMLRSARAAGLSYADPPPSGEQPVVTV